MEECEVPFSCQGCPSSRHSVPWRWKSRPGQDQEEEAEPHLPGRVLCLLQSLPHPWEADTGGHRAAQGGAAEGTDLGDPGQPESLRSLGAEGGGGVRQEGQHRRACGAPGP